MCKAQERLRAKPKCVRMTLEAAAFVEGRSRLGDWEADTVIGKGHRGALGCCASASPKPCPCTR